MRSINFDLIKSQDIKQDFMNSMAGEDGLMSDSEVKFEDDHRVTFDFK